MIWKQEQCLVIDESLTKIMAICGVRVKAMGEERRGEESRVMRMCYTKVNKRKERRKVLWVGIAKRRASAVYK